MVARVRLFFFFNDTATTEIYTLSLHDALPIYAQVPLAEDAGGVPGGLQHLRQCDGLGRRSEEHTSELQSLRHLVCRLLLEKKKKKTTTNKPCHTTPRTAQSHTMIEEYANLCRQ